MRAVALLLLVSAVGFYWYQGKASYKNGIYRNPKGGFAMAFPADWKAMDPIRGSDLAAGLSQDEMCALSVQPKLSIEALKFKASAVERLMENNNEKSAIEEVTINGATAFRVRGSVSGQPTKLSSTLIALPKGTLQIVCSSFPKRFVELEPVFERIVQSARAI